MSEIERKNIFNEVPKPILWLAGIFIAGIIIRIVYLPIDVPIKNDSFHFIVYAFKILEIGNIPQNIITTNTGWSYLLSGIFSVSNSDNMLQAMLVTRITSLMISAILVFPVFFIIRKFFNSTIGLIGASLLVLEPRLIQMSSFGTNYDLFLLIIFTSLALFFSTNKKMVFLVFPIIAFGSLVRYETLLMIIPFCIGFFYKFRDDDKKLLKFFVCLILFALIIIPISVIRTSSMENCEFVCDGIFENVVGNSLIVSDYYVQEKQVEQQQPRDLKIPPPAGERQGWSPDTSYLDDENLITGFISLSIERAIYYGITILIPNFIIFVPIGLLLILRQKSKKFDYKIITLIGISITVIIPALYGYGRDIQDPRYLFPIFIIYALISSLLFYKILNRFSNQNAITLAVIFCMIIFSLVFLEDRKINSELEIEKFEISRKIIEISPSINEYEYGGYIKVAELEKNWPELPEVNERGKFNLDIKKFSLDKINSLDELIIESNKIDLQNLIVFEDDQNEVLKEIFSNYEKYDNFKLVYDSNEDEFKRSFIILELIPFDGIRKSGL